MKKEDIQEIKSTATMMYKKSQELIDFVKQAPELARTINACGDLLVCVADSFSIIDPAITDVMPFSGESIDIARSALSFELPNRTTIFATMATLSGASISITQPIIDINENNEEFDINDVIPESYRYLVTSDIIVDKLNSINSNFGPLWKSVWDDIAIGTPNSVKSAAINARTVIDEISWLIDYDKLKELKWCKLDDKGKPTRATRFGWIFFGDNLPEDMKNDPTNDLLWVVFSKSYNELQHISHKADLKRFDKNTMEILMRALQDSLSAYLEVGIERLLEIKQAQ